VPAVGTDRIMEVRLNPARTTGADICLDAVVGARFNAYGVRLSL
jgi:hypothetical protein